MITIVTVGVIALWLGGCIGFVLGAAWNGAKERDKAFNRAVRQQQYEERNHERC